MGPLVACRERINDSPYVECSCKGYRTRAQQEAWEALNFATASLQFLMERLREDFL